jgi:glyoxylase-like metal-dependent hydrolase (beta-lactamase superfamily II)
MSVEYCVVSIGTLSHNHFWGEAGAVRTSHATTTLVTDGKRLILVDPSLPAAALDARLFERTGKRLADITDVFCTTLRPVHRRGIEALPQAKWWANEAEIHAYDETLRSLLGSAERLDPDDTKTAQAELDILERVKAAPEQFTPQVHLYPLAGPSAGSAGLLLTPPTQSVVIAGDAALTAEHVMRGQIWEGCSDSDKAMESLRDILELADIIIPGHDNVMLSTQRWV